MKIVKKVDLSEISVLNEKERAAIFSHYCSHTATLEEQQLAQSIATEARAAGSWIQCDCMPELMPACLFPRLTDSGMVTLVRPRPPRQNRHAQTCPFYLSDLPPSGYQPPVISKNEIKDFCLLKNELSHHETKVSSTTIPAEAKPRLTKLTRVLIQLINLAGLTKIDDLYPFHDFNRAVYVAAKNLPMWHDAPITLSDVLSTCTTTSHYYSLVNRLKAEKRFKNKRKQGYVVTLATTFTDLSVTLISGQEVKLLAKIKDKPADKIGPYWVIILLAEQNEGSNYFEAIRAALIPAYSDKLPIPVQNGNQRDTLRFLISWRLYWKQRSEDFSIIKPLSISEEHQPDFIIEDKESGNQLVIECMDGKDDEYLSNKTLIQTQFRSIGEVLEHSSECNALEFKKRITSLIMA